MLLLREEVLDNGRHEAYPSIFEWQWKFQTGEIQEFVEVF